MRSLLSARFPAFMAVVISAVLLSSCDRSGSSQTLIADDNSDTNDASNLDDSSVSTLNKDNVYDVVEGVISLLNEKPMRLMRRQRSHALSEEQYRTSTDLDTPYQFIAYSENDRNYSTSDQIEYDCAGGGSSYLYIIYSHRGTEDRVFNDCKNGEYSISGISGKRKGDINGVVGEYPYSDFRVKDLNGDHIVFSGNYYGGNTSKVELQHSSGWVNMQLSETSNEGFLQVSDFNMARSAREYEDRTYYLTSLEASFAVSGFWSDNNDLTATASLTFRGDADMYGDLITPFEWQNGSIVIAGLDGSTVRVTPGNLTSQSWVIELNGQVVDTLPATGNYWINCGS